MAIGPVTLNGAMSRAQDMTMLKHNEDMKGSIDQNNFQTQFQKEVKEHMTKVRHSDHSEMEQKKYDAREKGDNEYTGDGGKHRRQQEEKKDGKVIVRGRSSFDIKI
ncbi:MAG: hypothetical protein J6B10_09075 [Lachnospiraceae bacterium]|nr:hypothetical protein [Lachnospiraceae bacterium]